jgi:hypothetical protein
MIWRKTTHGGFANFNANMSDPKGLLVDIDISAWWWVAYA